jgi:hypothetical protein
MRNGIHIPAGVVRTAAALTAIAAIAIIIKELPEFRRYIKAETM